MEADLGVGVVWDVGVEVEVEQRYHPGSRGYQVDVRIVARCK